ncbi:hypothetical protein QL285_075860 [Trifolium repens]|nr:hypothetical protein QL285_075860 [Trifolium repens]
MVPSERTAPEILHISPVTVLITSITTAATTPPFTAGATTFAGANETSDRNTSTPQHLHLRSVATTTPKPLHCNEQNSQHQSPTHQPSHLHH